MDRVKETNRDGASHWPTSIAGQSLEEHSDEGDFQHQPMGHRAGRVGVRIRTSRANGNDLAREYLIRA